MIICASLGAARDVDDIGDADLVEIRMDIFDSIPECSKPMIVTAAGTDNMSHMPFLFDMMIDIGERNRPRTSATVIASHHDYNGTPGRESILEHIEEMDCDIAKCAYTPKTFGDLNNIMSASKTDKRHMLIGMGEFGQVTRIRQKELRNEFTYAYISEPTAPGQFSLDEMKVMGDDCTLTGLVGHPLNNRISQKLHNSAFSSAGINGRYLTFDAPSIDGIADTMRNYNIRGLNVTSPYKVSVCDRLDRIDAVAERIGAINTITNEHGTLVGSNTDIAGIEYAVHKSGLDIDGCRALILGSGGAARACAFFLSERGCRTSVTSRNTETAHLLSRDLGCRVVDKTSAAVKLFDLIVNCTTVGTSRRAYPIEIRQIGHGQTVFDMTYGETRLTRTAKKYGADLISGKDMLAAQATASFEIWTGHRPDTEGLTELI